MNELEKTVLHDDKKHKNNKGRQFILRLLYQETENILKSPIEDYIIDAYKEGMTQPRIAEEFLTPLVRKYGIKFASDITYLVIHNSKRLTDEERIGLRDNHYRSNGKRNHILKKGAHGISTERKKEIGRRLYELGIGFHGLTRDEKSRNGRHAARISATSNGHHLWSYLPDRDEFDEEKHNAIMPEIAYAYNRRLDGVTIAQISKEINSKWDNERDEGKLRRSLHRFRKSLYRKE